jgi:hypothetical protein
VRFEPATGRLFLCPDRPEATFSALCELVHIRLAESGASCNSPDGASRFQYPGLARSLTVYYVSGLVFFRRLFVPPFSLNQRCFALVQPWTPRNPLFQPPPDAVLAGR